MRSTGSSGTGILRHFCTCRHRETPADRQKRHRRGLWRALWGSSSRTSRARRFPLPSRPCSRPSPPTARLRARPNAAPLPHGAGGAAAAGPGPHPGRGEAERGRLGAGGCGGHRAAPPACTCRGPSAPGRPAGPRVGVGWDGDRDRDTQTDTHRQALTRSMKVRNFQLPP